MSNSKTKHSKSESEGTDRAAKRARFADKKEKEKSSGASPLVLVGGIVIVAAIIGGVAFALTRPSAQASPVQTAASSASESSTVAAGVEFPASAATRGHEPYPLVAAENGSVNFALNTFDDYGAHYYTYMHGEQPIEFFVLKSQDGVVRAAFNACDVCFAAGMGYTQDGDVMVCNNCGRRFPADQINVLQGGCNPSPLQRSVQGNDLIIQAADIANGLGYF